MHNTTIIPAITPGCRDMPEEIEIANADLYFDLPASNSVLYVKYYYTEKEKATIDDPPIPAYVEIDSVEDMHGNEVMLDKRDIETLEEMCMQDYEDEIERINEG